MLRLRWLSENYFRTKIVQRENGMEPPEVKRAVQLKMNLQTAVTDHKCFLCGEGVGHGLQFFCTLHFDQKTEDMYQIINREFIAEDVEIYSGDCISENVPPDYQSVVQEPDEVNRTDLQPKFRYFDPFISSGKLLVKRKSAFVGHSSYVIDTSVCPDMHNAMGQLFPNLK